jgi:hypothetical protein
VARMRLLAEATMTEIPEAKKASPADAGLML